MIQVARRRGNYHRSMELRLQWPPGRTASGIASHPAQLDDLDLRSVLCRRNLLDVLCGSGVNPSRVAHSYDSSHTEFEPA